MFRKSEKLPIIIQMNQHGSTRNALGLKSKDLQREELRKPSLLSYIGFGKEPNPWISEAPNERIKIKRQAYLDLLKDYARSEGDTKTRLEEVLHKLSEGSVDEAQVFDDNSGIKRVQQLSNALQEQDRLEYAQFVKTLSDAQAYGMVGKGRGRNPHLAEIITLFTYIYEEKPQNNPLLYGFPIQSPDEVLAGFLEDPEDVYASGLDGATARRVAVEGYMKKIAEEIIKIIDMSPQALGMTFSDDNVKHVAIVRKLKQAYNRLAVELDYSKRFTHQTSSEFQTNDYEFVHVVELPTVKSTFEKGKIYLMGSGRYALLDSKERIVEGDIQEGQFEAEHRKVARKMLENDHDVVTVEYKPARDLKKGKKYINRNSENKASGSFWVRKSKKSKEETETKFKDGDVYLVESTGDYYFNSIDPVTGKAFVERKNLSGNFEVTPKSLKDPMFKATILAITSHNGHTARGEKTDNYRLEDYDHSTVYEHEAAQAKISMRRKKSGISGMSIIFSILITIGQVAIAVFMATGVVAVLIGISCFITNVFLFNRDIKGFFISLIKGELWRGFSGRLKAINFVWLLASVATAVATAGVVMMGLVALFGFVIATAPAWVMLIAGVGAAVTIVGMTCMFFQAGVSLVKLLRGQTLGSLYRSIKRGIIGFFTPPPLNKEVQDLKAQVKAYKVALAPLEEELANLFKTQRSSHQYYSVLAKVEYLREQLYPIQGRLRRERIAHGARFVFKLLFSLVLAPMAFVAAFLATWGFSVLSVSGTADMLKVFLGVADKLAVSVSTALTAVSGVVNGVLSAKNLFNVGLAFAGKISKITVGVVYGIATVCNLAYYGKLWQTIKNGFVAYRSNPYKTIIPSLRMALAVAFGAAIVLNGYGNGTTAGAGAFGYLPDWLLKVLSPSTVTVVFATASSMALNKAAIDDAFKTDTPLMALENPKKDKPVVAEPILLPESVFAVGQKRKREPVDSEAEAAFFDRKDAFFNVKLRPGAVKVSAAVNAESREDYTDDYSSDSNSGSEAIFATN